MRILKKKKRVCFVHVPKCGGESIKNALKKSYKPNLETISIRARSSYMGANLEDGFELSFEGEEKLQSYREGLMRYFLAHPKSGLLMGHYRGTKETLGLFKDDWLFATMLRNPVERFFSNYFFNRHKKSDHFKLDMSLEDFVETEQAISWGNIYVRFFSSNPKEYNSPIGIGEAKQTLQKYDAVGLLENLHQFSSDCSKLLDKKLRIGTQNRNPLKTNEKEMAISDEVRRKVETLCKPSMAVYEFAKKLND